MITLLATLWIIVNVKYKKIPPRGSFFTQIPIGFSHRRRRVGTIGFKEKKAGIDTW